MDIDNASSNDNNRSDGMDFDAQGDINIRGDIVGHDKIGQQTIIVSSSRPLALEEFTVQESEIQKVTAIDPRPNGYESALEILGREKMLWIIGPSGTWKYYLAVSLATKLELQSIYKISRFTAWEQIRRAGPSNAVIILPNALGLDHFEKEDFETEYSHLRALLGRQNVVILTATPEVLQDASREVRLAELFSKRILFNVDVNAYESSKEIVFKRLVEYAHKQNLIDNKQQEWALDLLERGRSQGIGQGVDENRQKTHERFRRLLNETWLLSDIEDFVIQDLWNAKSPSQISDLLRQSSGIDIRVDKWFMELDDATQCFVLTLSLFAGFRDDELWKRHKQIGTILQELNSKIEFPTLGVLRQRATPYVTTTGPLDFVNASVFRAIIGELARKYREYFVEIKPLLKEWSIPSLPSAASKSERDNVIKGSEKIRNQIARMVGEVGKLGLEDVTDLLEEWASHPLGNVGKTAGIALRYMAENQDYAQQALSLLKRWSEDNSASQTAKYRKWAAASAFGRIALVSPESSLSESCVLSLEQL